MSKNRNRRYIYVFAHWHGMKEPNILGLLHVDLLRGKEIFSFEYDKSWLKSKYVYVLDPDLQMFTGLQYINNDKKNNFGIFLDSSPDRWGRILMRRRESAIARLENIPENNLTESDYLLGIFDGNRMGALRFKESIKGPFLDDNKEMASPPWTSIRKLEEISLRLEKDDITDDPDYLKWLNMLVAPGSSLGGARPKASVTDVNNNLWIAKFPSGNDNSDIGGWEIVTHKLALDAGINMSVSRAYKFSTPFHTFLTKRFDRIDRHERIHFASAMTMLGYTDGQDYMDGASYLELADFIIVNGANVDKDLEELWRRIVFSICVSNTDDHLRNHGFILSPKGWMLSPAYDINPVETGTGLKLNISDNDNSLDLQLAMDVCGYFRLDKTKAEYIINKVKRSVQNWKSLAVNYNISRVDQELKAMAFSRAYD